MENKFKYSNSNKRYYTLDYYYKNKYGCKISKISLNMGLTCPNKDGSKGVGGCVYCSKMGSGEYAGSINKSLKEQFEEVKNIMLHKWSESKFIAYFQANTNTYGPLDKLVSAWNEVLTYDNVVGINISTRPDSISKECFEELDKLNKKTDLVVELGLQTVHDRTSKLINRCHTLKEFDDCLEELNKRNIKVLVHIINGLPGESKEDMLETVKYLSNKNIWGIKIHMLNVLKDTKLYEMYKEEPFHILTKEEYVDIVCDELELLREDIVINRLTADGKLDDLIEPKWIIKKVCVLNDIDKEMARRNSYQGIKKVSS
jgi:hypothetical protein